MQAKSRVTPISATSTALKLVPFTCFVSKGSGYQAKRYGSFAAKQISGEKSNSSTETQFPPPSSMNHSFSLVSTPTSPSGSTQSDPFWTLPIDYSPLFPPIIAHYIQNLALPVSDLDGPSQRGLLRTHWFPMAMKSPATMYSLLLMSACHFHQRFNPVAKIGDATTDTVAVSSPIILTLKANALSEINKCLLSDDISIAVSDTTIGAVAKLAAFEAVFGDVDAYLQHMIGLQRMLQIRRKEGGVQGSPVAAMGPLDSFLKKLVRWIDLNAAYFTGRPGRSLLLDLDADIKEPNPLLFAGTERCRAQILLPVED